jgi:hypothetical protein
MAALRDASLLCDDLIAIKNGESLVEGSSWYEIAIINHGFGAVPASLPYARLAIHDTPSAPLWRKNALSNL